MATQKETPFQAWEFTPEEWPIAACFNDLQEKHIRTELAVCATEKNLLAVTPDNPTKYLMEQEFIRGKMEILAYLLTVSETTRTDLQKAIEEKVASQASDSNPAASKP